MAHPVGFAWSTVASVCAGVSAFDSTDIYPFNRSRVPEYLFSISYTNETVTSMEIACPNIAPVLVPSASVTNSQNVLPILAEGSLINLSISISMSIPIPISISVSICIYLYLYLYLYVYLYVCISI